MPELSFGAVEKILFALAILGGLAYFSYTMYRRLALVFRAQPDARFGDVGRNVASAIKFGFGQGRMPQDLVPGLFHIFIFVGFMVLSLRTLVIFGMGFGGAAFNLENIPGIGGFIGPLYAVLRDLVVIGVLIGCAGFTWRRLVSKPVRMQNIVHWEAVLILCWIASLMFADMLLEGGYLAWAGENGFPHHAWAPQLGQIFEPLFDAESGALTWKAMVWVHSVLILGFLNYLPFGKHFHVITAIPNTFFGQLQPGGRIVPIHDIEGKFEKMETDPTIAIGIAKAEDLSWKQIMDVYSCTECGRCVPYCPAWSTDKPLSHRQVNKDIRANLMEKADFILGKKANGNGNGEAAAWDGKEITGQSVLAETIWSCTLCKDCEDRCPVLIEQVPRIVQMRQYLSMLLGEMPAEVANFMKNVERNSNPWGLGPDKRADWIAKAAEEGIPVKQMAELTPEELQELEYLFFVGCMGSFDDRSNKVTRALCKILNAAGVKYAVLGVEEQCNGETARRLGNEYLAQMMMTMNIQTFMAYGVKKIITFCPHCFNTIKNEYTDFIPGARDTLEDKDTQEKLTRTSPPSKRFTPTNWCAS
ncbi:MAG: (Fe-S)-binding protein [Deltaproteobacteria bacterium]|nr:(Fe-S)-binding protein [Deltaproteobacteria bacterium]